MFHRSLSADASMDILGTNFARFGCSLLIAHCTHMIANSCFIGFVARIISNPRLISWIHVPVTLFKKFKTIGKILKPTTPVASGRPFVYHPNENKGDGFRSASQGELTALLNDCIRHQSGCTDPEATDGKIRGWDPSRSRKHAWSQHLLIYCFRSDQSRPQTTGPRTRSNEWLRRIKRVKW